MSRIALHRFLAVLCVIVPTCLVAVSSVDAAPPQRVDVLIGFRNAPGPNDAAFLKAQGGRIKYTYSIVPAVAVSMPQQALAGLARNPNVALVEEDGTVQAINVEYENAWGTTRIAADLAHGAGITGKGVKVAVIDSGIDYTHSEFAANYAGGYDFVNDDADPFDDNGHGTHCAGTIAAAANGQGVIGVAPDVELYALKVLNANGSGSFSDMIAALDWCVEQGIQLTNNSYGASRNPGSIVEQAFINANAAGILNLAAAGNSGNLRGKGNNVEYPAAYGSVVAVSATDQNNTRAYFSSTGPAVEIAAPGLGVYSTVPGDTYDAYSGTSMACPHAVGAAALLIEAGGLDNEGVRDLLVLSATDLGSDGVDNLYGHGLVDVAMALQMIDSGFVPPDPPDDPPPVGSGMSVAPIGYFTSGGKNGDRDLIISVSVVNAEGSSPVANATVSIIGYLDGSAFGSTSGVTDQDGIVSFRVRRASSGLYNTEVTSVAADGYEWDGATPDDPGYLKP